MKKIFKKEYIVAAVAFSFVMGIIIVNINRSSGGVTDEISASFNDKKIHFNKKHRVIDDNQKEQKSSEANSPNTILPELSEENIAGNDINKNYADNPKNIKLKELIEEVVKNVDGLPRYIWEPVRFSESDIDEHITNLKKIIIHSTKVKSKNYSAEDKKILSMLIASEIKEKIEYFNTICVDVWRSSTAKAHDDDGVIDESFRECKEKIKALEDKLKEYETDYP